MKLAVLLLLVVPSACSNPAAPRPLEGTFVLVTYHGLAVPVDFGLIPNRAGPGRVAPPSTCHLLLPAGQLTIASSGAYSLSFEIRNSCGNLLIDRSEESGFVHQSGGGLILEPDYSVPPPAYTGTLVEGFISLAHPDGTLIFAR